MEDYKKNWRDFKPPTIPIYFMEHAALDDMLTRDPNAISIPGLEMMLGYFEEFEKFEKAVLVRDAIRSQKVFKVESPQDPPDKIQGQGPPNDGHEWTKSEDGKFWTRKLTKEENDDEPNKKTDKGEDPPKSSGDHDAFE